MYGAERHHAKFIVPLRIRRSSHFKQGENESDGTDIGMRVGVRVGPKAHREGERFWALEVHVVLRVTDLGRNHNPAHRPQRGSHSVIEDTRFWMSLFAGARFRNEVVVLGKNPLSKPCPVLC